MIEINRAILLAATRQFLTQGYDRTSMDAIASAARVSKGTLYDRYSQKQLLFQAVVADRLAAWAEVSCSQDWKLGNTLEQRLTHRITMAMTFTVSQEARAWDRLLAGAPVKVANALRAARTEQMIDILAHDIDEYTRADGKPARDPRKVATDLLAASMGWLRIETLSRDVSKHEVVAYGRHAVQLLLAARAIW